MASTPKVDRPVYVAAFAGDQGEVCAVWRMPFGATPLFSEVRPIEDGFLLLAPSKTSAEGLQDHSPLRWPAPFYMLRTVGGNIGVSVGDDGIVIVDDQFAPLASNDRAKRAGRHQRQTPQDSVIEGSSHFHFVATLAQPQCSISASRQPHLTHRIHENVRKRLKEGSVAAGVTTPPAPKESGLPGFQIHTISTTAPLSTQGLVRMFLSGRSGNDG